MLNPP
jgi:hypothetical protein